MLMIGCTSHSPAIHLIWQEYPYRNGFPLQMAVFIDSLWSVDFSKESASQVQKNRHIFCRLKKRRPESPRFLHPLRSGNLHQECSKKSFFAHRLGYGNLHYSKGTQEDAFGPIHIVSSARGFSSLSSDLACDPSNFIAFTNTNSECSLVTIGNTAILFSEFRI